MTYTTYHSGNSVSNFVYKVEHRFFVVDSEDNNIKSYKAEYIIHDRIDRDIFYDMFYPNTIESKILDTDSGVYEIDEFDYYDMRKIKYLSETIVDAISEYDKIQNRDENIDNILK